MSSTAKSELRSGADSGEPSGVRVRPGEAQADQRLINALVERDERVLDEFYRNLRPAIDGALCRVLGHRETDHEDYVQMSFEQITDSLLQETFHQRCSLKTWAGVIASRIALAELRRRYRLREVFSERDPEQADSIVSDTGRLEARSELLRVRQALACLPSQRAEAVLLSDVEQYSLSEIAEILGVNEGAAHARIVRGRRQLRGILGTR